METQTPNGNSNTQWKLKHSRIRDEGLNEELFLDLADAKKKIERWRKSYNDQRPHSSIGMKTPKQFEEEFGT
jgi:putative transposase